MNHAHGMENTIEYPSKYTLKGCAGCPVQRGGPNLEVNYTGWDCRQCPHLEVELYWLGLQAVPSFGGRIILVGTAGSVLIREVSLNQSVLHREVPLY